MAKFASILLVEDDPITVMVCDRIIKMSGFSNQVQSKQNGQEAINHLKLVVEGSVELPDIIFLDINMPVMNGWDFLQEFETFKLQLQKLPRIFILSSTVDPEDYKKAAEFSTVEGFISKPLTQEHLKSVA
jgi:CitB family two-component system response regulator MalR